MTVIDLSEQTDDIRCRYWEYWPGRDTTKDHDHKR